MKNEVNMNLMHHRRALVSVEGLKAAGLDLEMQNTRQVPNG